MNVNLTAGAGVAGVQRDLVTRRARLTDLEPALKAVASDMLAVEARVWATEGGAIGEHWKPLSPRYAKWKARRYPGARLLEQTGRLRKSLSVPGASWQRFEVGPTEMVLSTTLGIAKVHQSGGTVSVRSRGGKQHQAKIPKRQMVKVRRDDRLRWAGYVDEYLETGRTTGVLVRL
jgi:phage gpG-like protein